MQAPDIHVENIIEKGRMSPFQAGLLFLCGLCLIIDGFDVQAMGYVAPAIIRDWGIGKAALGPVFGAGLFGMLVGSLILTPVADRFGRRPVLILSTIFVSVCMLATTLVGEYSPARARVSRMMLVSCGFTAGAAIGGFLSAMGTLTLGSLINRFGFTRVLIPCFICASVPVAAIGSVAAVLPMLVAMVLIAGFCIAGGQPALNTLAGTYYPTSLRSTGIGWSLGVGRTGSVLGPVLGGQRIALQWSNAGLFLAAAVPVIISALAMTGLHRTSTLAAG